MIPATLRLIVVMIASAINERMQRKLDYVQEEVRRSPPYQRVASSKQRRLRGA